MRIASVCAGNNGVVPGGTDGRMKEKNKAVKGIHPSPAEQSAERKTWSSQKERLLEKNTLQI